MDREIQAKLRAFRSSPDDLVSLKAVGNALIRRGFPAEEISDYLGASAAFCFFENGMDPYELDNIINHIEFCLSQSNFLEGESIGPPAIRWPASIVGLLVRLTWVLPLVEEAQAYVIDRNGHARRIDSLNLLVWRTGGTPRRWHVGLFTQDLFIPESIGHFEDLTQITPEYLHEEVDGFMARFW